MAALSMGAEGIIMGTRFVATQECPAHSAVKDWMKDANEDDTVIVQKTIKSPTRVAKNGMAMRVLALEQSGAGLDELMPLITGTRNPSVYSEGNLDDAIWSCGQAVGLVEDIPTCQQLLDRIMDEAGSSLTRVNALYSN